MAMPLSACAMETRVLALTTIRDRRRPETNASRTARSDAAPLDIPTVDKADCAVQSVHGHRLDWDEIPLRTPGKKD